MIGMFVNRLLTSLTAEIAIRGNHPSEEELVDL